MRTFRLDNRFFMFILVLCLYSLLGLNFTSYTLAQVNQQKVVSSIGSIVRPAVNPPSTGRISISGNQMLDTDGNPLLLVGAVHGLQHDVASSLPNHRNTREEIYENVADAGANFIVLAMNSELWSNDPRQREYRDAIDTYIQWCHKYGLFYQLKLHSVGSGPSGSKFSTAGSNYRITLPSGTAYKNRAIQMLEDLARLYGDDPYFAGFSLLNEPYNGQSYQYWEEVITYYEEAIDAVVKIDPDCIFYVMEPWMWGSSLAHWNSPNNPYRGYINRPNVVYEFHVYYHHWLDARNEQGGAWGYNYARGNFAAGDTQMRAWHNARVTHVQDDGYPVFNGEYGIYGSASTVGSDGKTPDPNYARAHAGQMQDMNALGIHHSCFFMYPSGSNPWCMASSDGYGLSERGEIWAANVPNNLIRPK